LFTASSVVNNYDEADIVLLSVRDHSRKTLLARAGMYPRYLTSGHLVFVTKGSLLAAPFDFVRRQLTGAATRLGDVAADIPIGFAQVDFSADGVCAIRTRGQSLNRPQWLDAEGMTEVLGLEAARYHYLRLSPDGGRLAYVLTEGPNSDLFIYAWQRGIKTRLTKGRVARSPVWSADGRFVVFAAAGGMFAIQSDGGGMPTQLTHSANQQGPETFSPDGQLVFAEKGQLLTLPVESKGGQMRVGEPKPLVKASNSFGFPSFSPDGHWLAYSNAQNGQFQVYVRAYPDNGRQVQVSDSGGILPLWSRNAQELFYRTVDQRIMSVDYSVHGDAFIPQRPRPWSSKKIADVGNNRNLDLAADGKRFVVLTPAETTDAHDSQSHITLVVNFFDEVRRRVAGQRK
jgi:serine/threonine-protein kinase